jgi:hypothetical protein
VRIGYVTGHNGFFNLGTREARARALDPRHLRRAVFRGRALRGALFKDEDWARAAQKGDAGWLFDPTDPGDPAVAAYLREGEASGVPLRAKVARRTPWYRVTRTQPPELLLTAMAGGPPRLALPCNPVAASNTLHGVWRLSATPAASAAALALAALSSLTELSAELEGHALGGGLLKLEPSEALRLVLPLPDPGAPAAAGPAGLPPGGVEALLIDADARLRRGDTAGARAVADGALLAWWPELGPGGAGRLAAAAAELRALRTGRLG